MNLKTSSASQTASKLVAALLVVSMTLSWSACAKSNEEKPSGTIPPATVSDTEITTMSPTPTTVSISATSKIPIVTSALPNTTVPGTSSGDRPLTTPMTVPVTVPATTPVTAPATSPITTPVTTVQTTPVTTPVTTVQTTPVTTVQTTPATTPVTTMQTTPATTPVTTVQTTPATTPATTVQTTPATTPVTTVQTTPATTPITPPLTTAPIPDEARPVLLYDDVKAMWVSQYDLNSVYVTGGAQREESDYTARIGKMLDLIKAQGFNTVFLQVRPNADSMAPSEYYPMSKYAVGAYGKDAVYDPVAIFVDAAHQRGLSIHAWINPLRGMKSTEITQVDPRYPIRQWYDNTSLRGKYIVLYNGYYYLNPAYEEVRQLIVCGATELMADYA